MDFELSFESKFYPVEVIVWFVVKFLFCHKLRNETLEALSIAVFARSLFLL